MGTLSILLLSGVVSLPGPRPVVQWVEGWVEASDGRPIEGANVFILETLEGDLTDRDGSFGFETRGEGQLTLIIQADQFIEYRYEFKEWSEPQKFVLEWRPVEIEGVVVEAGRLMTSSDPEWGLSTLDIVRTPGAAADIYRAFQTFAGIQHLDEGAGLFVRGGAPFETKVFLDDLVVLSPYRYESPTGGFFGAFDPFLLDQIYFSTGGFGARYGDALSGVADLSTRGVGERSWGGLTTSLATQSVTISHPLGRGFGVNLTGTVTDTRLLFRLNQIGAEFTEPPGGSDLSGGLSWRYTSRGRVSLFALDQRSRLGLIIDEPDYRGELGAREANRLIALSWKDRFGAFNPRLSLGRAWANSENEFGVLEIERGESLDQMRGELGIDLGGWVSLTVGAEFEGRGAEIAGRLPREFYDSRPGAPARPIDAAVEAERWGGFTELDLLPQPDLRLTLGLRTDHSNLTSRSSLDPRLTLAYRPAEGLTLLAAWGGYHQVADPLLYLRRGEDGLIPMYARHLVTGFHFEGAGSVVRLEAYDKDYHDLVQERRDGGVAAGGVGRSRGFDLFIEGPELYGLEGRFSWSFLSARRTDPETGVSARSPFDIRHTLSLVVDQRLGESWFLSGSARYATGRPYTPVIDARYDATRGLWAPIYGAPYSERLPDFSRIDLSLNHLLSLGGGNLLIVFLAVTNLLDRTNVHEITYSPDYSEPRLIRSQFERVFYIGASLSF